MKPILDKSLAALFEFHRSRITDKDIRDMMVSELQNPDDAPDVALVLSAL